MALKTILKMKRVNGYRKKGGVYLICDDITNYECKNTPLPLSHYCPSCGEELSHRRPSIPIDTSHVIRTPRKGYQCQCPICVPPERGFLVWLNSNHPIDDYKQDFSLYGISLGLRGTAGRIAVGDTVYIAHRDAVNRLAMSPKLENLLYTHLPEPVMKRYLKITETSEANRPGIIMVGRVREIQKLVSEAAAADEVFLEQLEERGLTPVLEVEGEGCSVGALVEPFKAHDQGVQAVREEVRAQCS